MIPTAGILRKRQRTTTTTTRISSTAAIANSSFFDINQNHHCLSPTTSAFLFNDSSTADIILRLFTDTITPPESPSSISVDSAPISDLHVYLHSDILRRAKYFSALLSDRWINNVHPQPSPEQITDHELFRLNLGVPPSPGSIQNHLTVLELLYTNDFTNAVENVSTALDLLPVALELLFEDCVRWCVRYLEAVPWTEEEENRVVNLIPFLSEEESKELIARISPVGENACEEMLEGLISSAMNNYGNTAFVKAFVGKILRDVSSRETVKRVLEKAFRGSLKTVKQSLEDYSSPVFRGDHNENETEAMQKVNLHKASTIGKHLLWLVERMVELRVADAAVREWSEQEAFTGDLKKAFGEDAWRNIVPGLPAVILRCTSKLAHAVCAGTVVASTQVRRKLVEDWLPVLVVCKDFSPASNKSLYLELEETFLRIISTLPMSDAQVLLQKCLSFSTRNVEDCPHLVTAFNTWFRRAAHPFKLDSLYSYSKAFSTSNLPSQIIKLVSNQNGIEENSGKTFGSSPRALINWLLRLENLGIRVFEDDTLKSHAKLCLDISQMEQSAVGTLDDKVTDEGLFYVDNVGEEENAGEEDNQSKLISDAFVAAAQTMKSSDKESRKRKGKSSGKKVKFVKYDLNQKSVPVKGGTSASNDSSSDESEVEDPNSDSDA